MNSFKTQQFRWAKGSAQTAKKLSADRAQARDIPFHVKMEALFHLTNNFAYVFLIVLAILQLPNMLLRQSMSVPELLLLDVPLFAATSGAMVLFYLTTHRALYNEPLGGGAPPAAHDGARHRAQRSTTPARSFEGLVGQGHPSSSARRSTASSARTRRPG